MMGISIFIIFLIIHLPKVWRRYYEPLPPNSKGDATTLEVYKCRRVECKPHPWHVGHNPYVRREV